MSLSGVIEATDRNGRTFPIAVIDNLVRDGEHRIGKFSISQDMLDEQWPDLLPLFARLVVIEARSNFATRTIDYEAYSPEFDFVPNGFYAPEYTAICTRIGKEVRMHFERVDCEKKTARKRCLNMRGEA